MTYYAGTVATGSNYVDTASAGVGAVRITISGNTATTNGFINATTPYITNTPNGSFSSQKVLHLEVNWAADTNSVTVLVEFIGYATGVDTVAYNIYDIDRNGTGANVGWTDQIRNISATNLSNTSVYASASNYTAGSTNSSVMVSNNNSLNLTVTGTNTAGGDTTAGDAFLTYGTNVVKSFAFDWGNVPGATADNPSQQLIGLSEITFRPRVPEVHPGLAAALGCGLMMAFRAFRRFRKS